MLGSLFSHKLELHRLAMEVMLPGGLSSIETEWESRDNAPGILSFEGYFMWFLRGSRKIETRFLH